MSAQPHANASAAAAASFKSACVQEFLLGLNAGIPDPGAFIRTKFRLPVWKRSNLECQLTDNPNQRQPVGFTVQAGYCLRSNFRFDTSGLPTIRPEPSHAAGGHFRDRSDEWRDRTGSF
jgi:hypothetical protein